MSFKIDLFQHKYIKSLRVFSRFYGVLFKPLALLFLFISFPADAHVKWFAPYDVAVAPKNILSVLTPGFIQFAAISIVAVFVMVLVDRRMVGMNQRIASWRQSLLGNLGPDFEFTAVRYTLIVFFTAVWTLGDVVLTPELKHNSFWISALHILIIVSLLSPATAKFAGFGIFALWGYSAYHYGFFHLSDYMIFLGIAVFVILSSVYPNSSSKLWRYLIMYAAISVTLQWASIEKFVYPEWTYPILEERPHLLMGLDKESFMDLAGIVEFVFAFLLIAVSGVVFIVATLSLAVIFILAIIDFGKVDAIGHLGIIASLFVMAIHGPSNLNRWLGSLHPSPSLNAFYVALLYSASLTLFFVLYYGIRQLWMFSSAH